MTSVTAVATAISPLATVPRSSGVHIRKPAAAMTGRAVPDGADRAEQDPPVGLVPAEHRQQHADLDGLRRRHGLR